MPTGVYDAKWLACGTPQGRVRALAFTLSQDSPAHTGTLSDEEQNGSGRIDACKQRLLTEAGAAAAIADYREAPALVDELLRS